MIAQASVYARPVPSCHFCGRMPAASFAARECSQDCADGVIWSCAAFEDPVRLYEVRWRDEG